jgi:chorismate synthase
MAVKKGQDVGRHAALADDDIKIAQLTMPGKEGLAKFAFIGQQDFCRPARASARFTWASVILGTVSSPVR